MSSNKDDFNQISQEYDPYAQIAEESSKNTLDGPKKETSREKKWRLLKQKFYETRGVMKQSFIMGAMVGGGFGFVFGLYNAVVYKSLIMLPVATVTSAVSFGFFLACGSIIRMDDNLKGLKSPELKMIRYDPIQNKYLVHDQEFWKIKYLENNNL